MSAGVASAPSAACTRTKATIVAAETATGNSEVHRPDAEIGFQITEMRGQPIVMQEGNAEKQVELRAEPHRPQDQIGPDPDPVRAVERHQHDRHAQRQQLELVIEDDLDGRPDTLEALRGRRDTDPSAAPSRRRSGSRFPASPTRRSHNRRPCRRRSPSHPSRCWKGPTAPRTGSRSRRAGSSGRSVAAR